MCLCTNGATSLLCFLRVRSIGGNSFDLFVVVSELPGYHLRCIFLWARSIRGINFDVLFAIAEHPGCQFLSFVCGCGDFGGVDSMHFHMPCTHGPTSLMQFFCGCGASRGTAPMHSSAFAHGSACLTRFLRMRMRMRSGSGGAASMYALRLRSLRRNSFNTFVAYEESAWRSFSLLKIGT